MPKFTKGQQRLRTLYAVLNGLPESKVNVSTWRVANGRNDVSDDLLLHSCGTTGCAVGWACAYPPFQAEGLEFMSGMPYFKGRNAWDAVIEFFEINISEAMFMFGCLNNSGKKDRRYVMDRILSHLVSVGVISLKRADRRRVRDNL